MKLEIGKMIKSNRLSLIDTNTTTIIASSPNDEIGLADLTEIVKRVNLHEELIEANENLKKIEIELFEMRKGNSYSAMTADKLCKEFFPQRFAKSKTTK